MSTKIIPAQRVQFCDCCGNQLDNANSKKGAALVFTANVLLSKNLNGGGSFDLCDTCVEKLADAIDRVFTEVRKV